MATEMDKQELNKVNPEEQNGADKSPAEKQLPEEVTENESWFKKLGTGAKIGIGFAVAAVVGGAAWLVSSLLGKGDDDEPAAIEAGDEAEAE